MAEINDDQLVERLVPKILSSIRAKAKAVENLEITADLSGITSIPCYDTTGEQYKCVLVSMNALAEAARKPLEDDIESLQDRLVAYSNVEASSWVEDTSIAGYSYRCDLACTGVSGLDYAEVLFTKEDSLSGNYSSICETKEDKVSIWGTVNKRITIPVVIVHKG